MTTSSLVDILLVRLVRDEEKIKVRELLIKDAGISEEKAKHLVENTPCMITPGMEIQAARDLQNKMYPYIDILPRSYSDSSPIKTESFPEETEEAILESKKETDTDDFSHSFDAETADVEIPIDDSSMDDDDDEDIEVELIGDTHEEDIIEDEVDSDDDLIITSASEEVLLIERCHVCGRTPTDIQKLAPCRTCGERTCADCFDRVLHVCQKCAQEGKAIDRPIKDAPEHIKNKVDSEDDEYLSEDTVTTDSEDTVTADRDVPKDKEDKEKKDNKRNKKKDNKRTILLAVVLCVAVLAYVLVIDPFGLNLLDGIPFLSTHEVIDVPQPVLPDVISSTDDIDPSIRQTDMVVSDSLAGTFTDSQITDVDVAGGDSISLQDTLLAEVSIMPDTGLSEPVSSDALISLSLIQVSRDYGVPEYTPEPRLLETSPVNNIVVLTDSLQDIIYPVTFVAGTIPIQIDNLSFVLMQDSTLLLLMSILHPETLENRIKLVSRTAGTFDSTCVDQLVMYYRESAYHPITLMSFMSDSFHVISQNVSPAFIRQCQTYRPEIWDSINNQLSDWMTEDE